MKKLSIAFFTAIILSSCTSLKVTSNFDKELDISKSKTYSFYGWTEVNDMIDIDKQVIEKAFTDELNQRGLIYKELGGDINILFFLVVDKESTSNRYNSYFGPYGYAAPTWGWGTGYGYGYGSGTSAGVAHSENQFYKGTVVCNAFDNTSKKLAWQGVVVKAIKKNNPKRADIPKIVQKINEQFSNTKNREIAFLQFILKHIVLCALNKILKPLCNPIMNNNSLLGFLFKFLYNSLFIK